MSQPSEPPTFCPDAGENIRYFIPSPGDPWWSDLVATVEAAARVQDWRGGGIAPTRIPAPDAHLDAFRNMTAEQRSAAGRKGGRKTVADLAPRNAEIMRLWDNGLPVADIVRSLGLTANTIWGVIYRSRRSTPSQAQES